MSLFILSGEIMKENKLYELTSVAMAVAVFAPWIAAGYAMRLWDHCRRR